MNPVGTSGCGLNYLEFHFPGLTLINILFISFKNPLNDLINRKIVTVNYFFKSYEIDSSIKP
jgi:hypothetical protein